MMHFLEAEQQKRAPPPQVLPLPTQVRLSPSDHSPATLQKKFVLEGNKHTEKNTQHSSDEKPVHPHSPPVSPSAPRPFLPVKYVHTSSLKPSDALRARRPRFPHSVACSPAPLPGSTAPFPCRRSATTAAMEGGTGTGGGGDATEITLGIGRGGGSTKGVGVWGGERWRLRDDKRGNDITSV